MSRLWSFLLSIPALAALALAAVLFPIARAEVGAAVQSPQSPDESSIYVFGITDGPDPWGYWQLFTSSPRRVALNPEGFDNHDGRPSTIVHPVSGLAIVAWSRNSPQGYDVVYSTFSSGAWTEPIVLTGGAEDELDPSLTVAGDGTVHLFYWSAGTAPAVWHREAPADLSSWSAPVLVSQPGEPACRPSGIESDGELHVVYEVHDFGYGQTPRQIVLARREGAVFVPEVVALSQNPAELYPRLHGHDGVIWVDWVDWVDDPLGQEGEVAWRRRDPLGQWEPLGYEPFATVEEREWFVRGTVRSQAIE